MIRKAKKIKRKGLKKIENLQNLKTKIKARVKKKGLKKTEKLLSPKTRSKTKKKESRRIGKLLNLKIKRRIQSLKKQPLNQGIKSLLQKRILKRRGEEELPNQGTKKRKGDKKHDPKFTK